MPIMPWNKGRYPANWKEIRADILKRAGNRCEWCGVENGSYRVLTKIVLTIAHLDHQPENNEPTNLAALCQRCHLNYDRKHHIANRARHKVYKLEQSGQQKLFKEDDNSNAEKGGE